MSATLMTEGACTLLDSPVGCSLCVEGLDGSAAECSRLYAMGILPGTTMEVCQRSGNTGSVFVRVRQSSVVLGEGMARCIRCRAAQKAREQ